MAISTHINTKPVSYKKKVSRPTDTIFHSIQVNKLSGLPVYNCSPEPRFRFTFKYFCFVCAMFFFFYKAVINMAVYL